METQMSTCRNLYTDEIAILKENNNSAENWNLIKVHPEFDVRRLSSNQFFGEITIGSNNATITIENIEQSCSIKNAVLKDCHIGNNVYISSIGSSIQNYIIEDNVIIQDVFLLKADQNSKYGNGIKVSVLNEAGGREVVLFDELNAQIAYLQCFYKDRDIFQQKLHDLVTKNIKTTIAPNAAIFLCPNLRTNSAITQIKLKKNPIKGT